MDASPLPHPLTLGVLTPYLGGEYINVVLAQLCISARALGTRIICIRTGDLDRFDLPVAQAHFDGWVVLLRAISPDYLEQLAATGKPIASIGHNFRHPQVVSVESDNERSAAYAVNEMIRAGHQHIAFIGYLTEYDISMRLAGYRRALIENKLPYRAEYVFNTEDYGQGGGAEVAHKILSKKVPVTALFAGTDRNAAGAMTCFQNGGVRIPEDIAVVGYDNSSLTLSCVPPLASIDQNIDQMAERTITVLLEQIRNGQGYGGQELVFNTFIPRESCGLPPIAEEHRNEAEEIATKEESTNIYEIGRFLITANAETIKSQLKMLSPYIEWRCVAKWDEPLKEPDTLTIRDVHMYRDDHTDTREIRCDVKDFPPLAAMGKAADFDPEHIICVLPIVTAKKRLRLMAVSGLMGPSRRLTGLLQHFELFAPAYERTVLDEELAAYQSGLEELVKQRTLELMDSRDRAEAANKAKSSFLASMSHELRTPLNGILGYAQILKRSKNLSELQQAGLNTIERSGEHLLTIINDILDLAKIEAGKFDLYPDALDLPTFLRVIVDIVRIRAEQKNLLFVYDVSPNLPHTVHVDEKRLREVLLNLLGNAVKFTSSGQVSLRVTAMSEGKSNVRLRFDVQDTGVGINTKELEHIFQPFEQAGDAQQRLGGTGLGLAISREIIRLMGNEIYVVSRPGKGSQFWFELRLPVVQAEIVATPLERSVSGYEGSQKKVLVVDDIAENRAVVIDFLGPLGFDMFEATNGQEGLDQAQAHMPDLILMDNVMPVMTGQDATHRLRKLPAFKNVPIIAVSASAFDTDLEKSLAVGADAFLAKPINLNNLLKHVGALLQLHWTCEPAADLPDEKAGVTEPFMLPPSEELEVLLQMALTGSMRDIRQRADYLVTLDKRYGPFAEKLRHLAEEYNSESILGLIEKSIKEPPVVPDLHVEP